MSRMVNWLQGYEQRMFLWMNRTIQHDLLERFLSKITHLGGATFTILTSLCFILFANHEWSRVGFHSLLALVISHIPVAIMKRKYPRRRPYLVIPQIQCKHPLKDHSFPSGHTTAIFSLVTPFILFHYALAFSLLPFATMVGFSRIYLGHHYPSDTAVGAFLGIGAGYIAVAFSS